MARLSVEAQAKRMAGLKAWLEQCAASHADPKLQRKLRQIAAQIRAALPPETPGAPSVRDAIATVEAAGVSLREAKP